VHWPGLAAAPTSRLEELDLDSCQLGNDGMAGLVPDGHVNRSLTRLTIHENEIRGDAGADIVVALAARCTNLDRVDVYVDPDQRHRLDLLLERKRLVTAAQALAGSYFSDLFRFVEEEAHSHEHGMSAILVVLQNDGDDYFCNANNRAVD
jgi:hypothetical protein